MHHIHLLVSIHICYTMMHDLLYLYIHTLSLIQSLSYSHSVILATVAPC